MHNEGFLHRDIKPSNFVRDSQGNYFLTDLQNKREIVSTEKKLLPTRGATQYAHPSLLRAIVNEEEAGSSMKTDVYALGCTFFFALTGEHLFDYQTVGDSLSPRLQNGGSAISSFDKTAHNKHLDEQLRKAPRKFRSLIKDMVSDIGGIYNMKDVRERFEEVESKKWNVPAIAVASAFGIGSALIAGVMTIPDRDPFGPRLSEVLEESFQKTELTPASRYRSITSIQDSFESMRGMNQLEDVLVEAEREGIDRRLVSSILRSVDIHNQEYEFEGKTPNLHVPINFLLNNDRYSSEALRYSGKFTKPMEIPSMIHYLKLGIDKNPSVDEMLVHYFVTDNVDMINARESGENLIEGLPERERDLVTTALTLYSFTNPDGSLDTEEILAQEVPKTYTIYSR